MPRVHHIKARKDYPDIGVKKGEMYYKWKIKTGPVSGVTRRSKEAPKPSQLTASEYASTTAEFCERDFSFEDSDDAEAQITELAEEIRAFGEEQQSKKDNMPEGLQEGDTGQLLEARAEACENVASELEGVDTSWDEPEQDEDESKKDFETRLEEEKQQRMDEIAEEVRGVLEGASWE